MVEPLILLDEIGISLLGFPKFSSFFDPDTLRTTFMLGVGTFVMRFEVWYVTNCLLRGNGGEGEGDGVLTDGESRDDCETSK